jgi:hypothetical protein
MASNYDDLDETQRRVADAALRSKGIDPAATEQAGWQADPEIQRLVRELATIQTGPFSTTKRTRGEGIVRELNKYVDANRERLGIPSGFYPRGDNKLHQ